MELKQVLCVDDSEADQFLNKYWIETVDRGIEVRQCFDGQEALELVREPGYRPDLILLDINMPRMNGFEFLDAYCAEFGDEASAVVVMLTSSLLEKDREKAERYPPVRGFLFKPLSAAWFDEVREALAKAQR